MNHLEWGTRRHWLLSRMAKISTLQRHVEMLADTDTELEGAVDLLQSCGKKYEKEYEEHLTLKPERDDRQLGKCECEHEQALIIRAALSGERADDNDTAQ